MIRHKQITTLSPNFVNKKLKEFFKEDEITEDITTKATQKDNKIVEASFVAKERMVFAGKEIIIQGLIDKRVSYELAKNLYSETPNSIAFQEELAKQKKLGLSRSHDKPNKKQRRKIIQFKQCNSSE